METAYGCPAMTAGSSCMVNVAHGLSCFGPAKFKMTCPADNTNASRAADVEGTLPEVLCKVCSLKVGADTDLRKGFFSGEVTFGPNILSGRVNESVITEYRVVFADSSGGPLGDVLTVHKSPEYDAWSCCKKGAYTVKLTGVKILPNAAFLTVLPVNEIGVVLPVGERARFVDLPLTTTTTTRPHFVRLAGNLVLWVNKPAAFAGDPQVEIAMREAIALVADISPTHVHVFIRNMPSEDMSLLSSSNEAAEALAHPGGRVVVSYILDLRSDADDHKVGALARINAQTPKGLARIILLQLVRNGLKKKHYVVTVMTKGTPTPDKTPDKRSKLAEKSEARLTAASAIGAQLMSLCMSWVALRTAT